MVVMGGFDSGVDGPDRPGLSDDEIRELITTQATLADRVAIQEVFGSVKTMLIEMFDECYVIVTKFVSTTATTAIAAA